MTFTDAPWWAGHPTATPPRTHDGGERVSRYLTVADGTRLAADITLPKGLRPRQRVPTILSLTIYLRGMDFRFAWAGALLARMGKAEIDWGQLFAEYGYAFVQVETRGAGASFGSKSSVFMPDVVADGGDVLDWITAQPWSDGTVGATGISALGLTSMMLASGKHPALKAIAPRFTAFDMYQAVHPGGLLQNRFLTDIGRTLRALDTGRLHELAETRVQRYALQALVRGVRGVDADHDRSLLRAAQAEHQANEHVDRSLAEVTYRDQQLPHTSIQGTCDIQTPFAFASDLQAAGIPIYAYTGWMDGPFQREMTNLFANVSNPGSRLTIGPWAHGGMYHSSPLAAPLKRPTQFPQAAELVRFFDLHLRGIDRSTQDEGAVQYFTMAEERWKHAPTWPPPGLVTRRMHLCAGEVLHDEAPASQSRRAHRVDLTHTTGMWSRYGKHQSGGQGPAIYPDRAREDAKLACFTSTPLDEDTEVTGHPIVTLQMTCDAPDAGLFVYLEDVAPDGTVLLAADGCLRVSRRSEAGARPYHHLGVWHSHTEVDAQPITPGEVMTVRMDLLPTSWLFRKGHRIRVAIGGADADSFVRVPQSGDAPTFTFVLGGDTPSFIDLPVMPRKEL